MMLVNTCSIRLLLHEGQVTDPLSWSFKERATVDSFPQSRHLYSYIGIGTPPFSPSNLQPRLLVDKGEEFQGFPILLRQTNCDSIFLHPADDFCTIRAVCLPAVIVSEFN